MTLPIDYFEVRSRNPSRPRGEVRVAPQIVYPDSALGRATNALGPESGLLLGERVIKNLAESGGTLVLAGHPGNGKSTVEQSFVSGLQNYGCLSGVSSFDIQKTDIRDEIAAMKAIGWSPNVLTWNSQQWEEVDSRFQQRLERLHEARGSGSVIVVETGGTNFTIDGVERNQGGKSLQWLVSTQDPIVLFLKAASHSVPALAGVTREMAVECASVSMLPRRLRQEYNLSFVGSSGRVTQGMLRGAPAHVIEGFEREIESQIELTDHLNFQRMLQRIQIPRVVSLQEEQRAARGAALYALEMEKLGILGSHKGLSTVLYTYAPTSCDPLRVRMPLQTV